MDFHVFVSSFSDVEEEEDFHLRSANEINVCPIHYFKTGIVPHYNKWQNRWKL